MELLFFFILSSFSKIYLCLGIKASSMHEISVFCVVVGFFSPFLSISVVYLFPQAVFCVLKIFLLRYVIQG